MIHPTAKSTDPVRETEEEGYEGESMADRDDDPPGGQA